MVRKGMKRSERVRASATRGASRGTSRSATATTTQKLPIGAERYQHRAPCKTHRKRGDDDYHAEVSGPEVYQHRAPCKTHRKRSDDNYHAEVTHRGPSGTSKGHGVKHIGNEATTTTTQRLPIGALAVPAKGTT